MLNRYKSLSIQNDGERMIIKFPARVETYMFSFLIALGFPILPILLPDFFGNSRIGTIGIIFYVLVVVFNVYYFVRLFTRKVIIDKRERTIIYNSLLREVFNIDEIEKMENKNHDGGEGGTTYSLVVHIRNKKIGIETQSDDQSLLLKEEILLLINKSRNGD